MPKDDLLGRIRAASHEYKPHSMTPTEILQAFKDCSDDYVPTPSKVVVEGDFRKRILAPGHGRLYDDFIKELAEYLQDKPIFNRDGMVMVLEGKKLKSPSPAFFRSWLEDPKGGDLVCQTWAGRGEDAHLQDTTLSEDGAKGVLASPQFVRGLREIKRVNLVRLPVKRAGGVIELAPVGYDQESKILTIETVGYDEAMPITAVTAVVDKWFADVAFHPDDSPRSKSATLAMMLASFCDCMLSDFAPRPCFIVTANCEGAGKTILVTLALAPVFGPVKLTPPPTTRSGDKLTELLNSIAQSGSQYLALDNWKGKVEHSGLEAFLSANAWAGRVLGTSYTFETTRRCLVYITSNQAFVGGDMRRRALFVTLFVAEARAEDRHIHTPLSEEDILAGRPEILAALWSLVRAWRDAGCAPGQTDASFPEWGKVIGGVAESAGFESPLQPPPMLLDERLASFTMIIQTACNLMLSGTSSTSFRPAELLELAREAGAFTWFIGPEKPEDARDQKSEGIAFGKQCEHYDGRVFTLESGQAKFKAHGKGHSRRYEVIKAFLPPPEWQLSP
jgi:hypothetical protein